VSIPVSQNDRFVDRPNVDPDDRDDDNDGQIYTAEELLELWAEDEAADLMRERDRLP
jgi:hypothetical protein